MVLSLEVPEFEDEAHWRWRLIDAGGAFVADHVVALDRSAAEYEGFLDPYRYVRWYTDREDEPGVAQRLVEQIGVWIGEHVWGQVGEAIVERAHSQPVVVQVRLPLAAEPLLFRPLELGFVDGKPLAEHDVSLVFQPPGAPAAVAAKPPVGDRLRMLALFSVPSDQTALNLRHERRELRKLVQRIARTAGRAIELRVLQYGVTRARLQDVLDEAAGWDIIHFSGHGLPAGLVLERVDGTADTIPTDEFAELLWPARAQLKLVTLSSCESAAASVAQTMRSLGLPSPDDADGDGEPDRPLPAVAQGLVSQLGCAAVAMRYPVDDGFAIALSQHLYTGLLRDRHPLPRALQVAIHRAVAQPAGGAAPPLATATPVLLDVDGVPPQLEPPLGRSEAFDVSIAGMAYFPPEPQQFIGRVGVLARASAALALESDRRAIVLHGMAGAGKTAGVLELAYRHREGRFEAMAWYSAPVEGDDVASALVSFAIALQTQLDGLEFVHVVDDLEQLTRFLPRISGLMADRSVLIVLDNVESLLHADGTWRDERWRVLVEALITHDGDSRLALTSRRVPEALLGDRRVLIEPVGSLSPRETVLLASQLPNLGRLIESDAADRELARQVLETVQGNPKLIQLADRQALDAAALRERLADAAAAWDRAGRELETFFHAGPHAAPDDEEFLEVLDAWTVGTSQRLSEHARTALQVVCALERHDRIDVVVQDVWVVVWRELGREGEPPDPGLAIDPAVQLGLIDVERSGPDAPAMYSVHPAVEQATRRAAGPAFQEVVDRCLAVFWREIATRGREEEAEDSTGELVVAAGLAAAPYLLRRELYAWAINLLTDVIDRSASSSTLARALPLIEQLAERCVGTPLELVALTLLLKARAQDQPAKVLPLLPPAIARAVEQQDWGTASALGGLMSNKLMTMGRLEEALASCDAEAEYTRRAGLGPWTQLADRGKRVQILLALERHAAALEEARELLSEMDGLPLRSEHEEILEPWNVRETTLDVARSAAVADRELELALELNATLRASQLQRGASILQQAETAFNDYGPLLELGRQDQVVPLLRWCRQVFEAEGSREGLAVVFSALASLEDEQDHPDQAIEFELRAVRLKYALGRIDWIVGSHNNLTVYLVRAGRDRALMIPHLLAAATLEHQIRSGRVAEHLLALIDTLDRQGAELPGTFAEVHEQLDAQCGVDLAGLFAALPGTSPTGEAALQAVREQARGHGRPSPEEAIAQLVATTVAAAQGDEQMASVLDEVLDRMAKQDQWRAVTVSLRSVVAGDRDRDVLLAGLDDVDTKIVSAVLDQLG